MKTIIILLTVFGLTFLLVGCSGYKFNFTCNDSDIKNLKKCKDGNMFQWNRTF